MTAMPRIKPLRAQEILEVRHKLREDVQNLFHVVNGMVDRYRELLDNNPSLDKLRREATYLAKTKIQPEVERLKRRIETPGEIIKSELINFMIEAPALAWKVKTNPSIDNLLDLATLGSTRLKTGVGRYMTSEKIKNESGLSLLLKLPK